MYWLVLQVKQLEDGVAKLVEASDECTHLSNAIQSIGNEYQPATEVSLFLESFPSAITQYTWRYKL